jgi:hypothetical protein
MTDVNRLCKEANFNQYLFERVTKFLVNAQIIDVSKGQREYVPGEYTMTFWQRDIPTLQHASRRAFLALVQQLTGYQAWRPTIAVQSDRLCRRRARERWKPPRMAWAPPGRARVSP